MLYPKNELLTIEMICKLNRSDANLKWDNNFVITTGTSTYNQSNLAIKGIIAISAMSKMSLAAGHVADADKYSVCSDPSN